MCPVLTGSQVGSATGVGQKQKLGSTSLGPADTARKDSDHALSQYQRRKLRSKRRNALLFAPSRFSRVQRTRTPQTENGQKRGDVILILARLRRDFVVSEPHPVK